jgi:hypothetical protein
MPQATENFTMRNIKYQQKDTGDVAQGMSVTVSICFSAPSFGDFDDVLSVVTEDSSFKVPLRARRESFNLSTPSIACTPGSAIELKWLSDV